MIKFILKAQIKSSNTILHLDVDDRLPLALCGLCENKEEKKQIKMLLGNILKNYDAINKMFVNEK